MKDNLKKMKKNEDNQKKIMENDINKNGRRTKINLIGCDTIVNSPS